MMDRMRTGARGKALGLTLLLLLPSCAKRMEKPERSDYDGPAIVELSVPGMRNLFQAEDVDNDGVPDCLSSYDTNELRFFRERYCSERDGKRHPRTEILPDNFWELLGEIQRDQRQLSFQFDTWRYEQVE